MDDKLFDIFSEETDVPECVLRRVDETLEMIENSAESDKGYVQEERTGRVINGTDRIGKSNSENAALEDKQLYSIESTRISSKGNSGTKRKSRRKNWKRSLMLIFAAVLTFGATVFAAEKYMGISSFFQEVGNKMPEEVQALIEKDPVQQEDGDSILTYTVKEALCDKNSVQVVVEATAKERGKYFLVGQDAMDEDSVKNLGIESDKTIGEYAAEKGLIIVKVGASFDFDSDLGIETAMSDYRSQEDDVIDFYSSAVKTNESENLTVSCIGTAMLPGAKSVDDVMRTNITFQLEDKSQERSVTYVPEAEEDNFETAAESNAGEVDAGEENSSSTQKISNSNTTDAGVITAGGKIKVIYADIEETEMGDYATIHYILLKESDSFSLDVTDSNGNVWQISDLGGYAPRAEVGKEAIWQINYQKTDLPDEIGIRVYDPETGTAYEPVILKIQK